MSYPYPPMGPGEQPPEGQPGGWGAMPPAPGGYGPSGAGWQHQETMPAGAPMGQPGMMPPMGPPYGQPPMGPMGQHPMGPQPKQGGGGGMVVVAIVAAIVLVGGVLGGAYYVAAGGDGGKGGGTSPTASAATRTAPTLNQQPAGANGHYQPGYYSSMKSWSLWDKLNTASQDSKPMSLDEVFNDPEAKSQKDSLSGAVFTLQGSGRLDTDCAGTVWGAELQTALRNHGCTQVIRAAYVSGDQRWVGQLAVFNLKDVNSANSLLQDLDPKVGNKGFVLPVGGPSPIDRFGKGTTGAQSGAYGHFVVIGWVGHADDTTGSTYGIDTIGPSSAVQRAGKEFLFTRNIR